MVRCCFKGCDTVKKALVRTFSSDVRVAVNGLFQDCIECNLNKFGNVTCFPPRQFNGPVWSQSPISIQFFCLTAKELANGQKFLVPECHQLSTGLEERKKKDYIHSDVMKWLYGGPNQWKIKLVLTSFTGSTNSTRYAYTLVETLSYG